MIARSQSCVRPNADEASSNYRFKDESYDFYSADKENIPSNASIFVCKAFISVIVCLKFLRLLDITLLTTVIKADAISDTPM